jgi:hypothetical protein
VKVQDLILPGLIGLPVVAAYCLAFIVASVINGGRSWPLWLLLLVVCCVLWGLAYSDTQRTMNVVEPSWEGYSIWPGPQRHSSQPERPFFRASLTGYTKTDERRQVDTAKAIPARGGGCVASG